MDIPIDVFQNELKKPEKPEKPVVGAASSDEDLKEAWMRCLNLRELKSSRHVFEPI
jgi:hypothetical protein